MTPVALLFPGQGVQRRGMGGPLFDLFPDLVAQADDILGYSLRRLCVDDPDGRLDETGFTQPALYVVNALAHRKRLLDGAPPADVLLGHSLGEYNALEAAGAFDFGTGLRLVRERARLMAAVTGSMTAISGLPVEQVEASLAAHPELGAYIAAVNAPRQVVVAHRDRGEETGRLLSEAGAVAVTALRVSGPFHSRYMAGAAAAFGRFLRRHRDRFRPPRIPVVGNRRARPHEARRMVADLTGHIDHPVLWCRSVETLLAEQPGLSFVEINGRTLSSFTRQIVRGVGGTAGAVRAARETQETQETREIKAVREVKEVKEVKGGVL